MVVRIALFICALGMLAVSTTAQRTITNADLARYRDERVKADDELRSEYARKGISYDEVMRRNKESQNEMIELSAKLRAARLEKERVAAELAAAAWQADARRRSARTVYFQQPDYWNGGWFSYGYGAGRSRARFGTRTFQQPGYFAGGQFWPMPAGTIPRSGYFAGGQFWPTPLPAQTPRVVIATPHSHR